MTIQEAIKQLKYQRAMFNFDPMTGEVGLKDKESREGYDACTLAIRSLEAWEEVLEEIRKKFLDCEKKAEANGASRHEAFNSEASLAYRSAIGIINEHLSEVEGKG